MGLQISKLQKNFKRLFSPFSFEHMKSSFQFFKTFCEILLQNCMKLERENFGRLCHVLWNMYIILAFSQKNINLLHTIVTILLFLEDSWLIKAIVLSHNNWLGVGTHFVDDCWQDTIEHHVRTCNLIKDFPHY